MGGRFWIICVLSVGAVVSAGCTLQQMVRNPQLTSDRRWIANGLEHGLPAVPEVAPGGLDYDALYTLERPPGDRETSVTYIRFWPDGRAIFRTAWGVRLYAFNGDNFSHGLVARWGAEGDHLVVKTLSPGQPWHGEFVTRRAQVVDGGNRLIFYHRRHEAAWGVDTRDNEIFVRQPVPGMRRQPDW